MTSKHHEKRYLVGVGVNGRIILMVIVQTYILSSGKSVVLFLGGGGYRISNRSTVYSMR
jgi:hypothetical protein